MIKTKIEHVTRAYEYLRISGLTVQPSPVENNIALSVMEDMMAEFRSRNICSSYVFEDEPDPNTDSGINSQYNSATAQCLALRLFDMFSGGKPVPINLMRLATSSLSNWSATTSKTNQIDPPRRQPRGSGNTFRFPRWLRYYRIEGDAPISCDTLTLKVNEIDFFSVDFSGYLLSDATITSYTLDNSDGIEIIQSANTDDAVNFEVKGLRSGTEHVTITITTTAGRVNPEKVYITVSSQ